MYRFWNDICICKTCIVIRTSGNLAAILDFEHTSTSQEIGSTTTRQLDPENIRVGVGIFTRATLCYSAGLCDSDVSVCLSVRHTPVLCLAERKQDREMYTI